MRREDRWGTCLLLPGAPPSPDGVAGDPPGEVGQVRQQCESFQNSECEACKHNPGLGRSLEGKEGGKGGEGGRG